jgi:hypothetical protein
MPLYAKTFIVFGFAYHRTVLSYDYQSNPDGYLTYSSNGMLYPTQLPAIAEHFPSAP